MEMIDMNILDILKNKYKECEPIFDYEIYALGFTDKDIEDTIKDNEFEELDKIDIVPCRIFYLVGYNEKFNIYLRLFKSSDAIVIKYFVGNDFQYGYLYGLSLQNMLGISTQVPRDIYIKSTKVDSEIKYSHFVIEPDKEYTESDFKYIELAEILKYQGMAEYDLSGRLKELKNVCIDTKRLNKYREIV